MRPEKELLLNEIKDKIDASTAMIVTRYDRMAPNVSWEFRDQLSKAGGLFTVVRKRVFMKAAQQAGLSFGDLDLKGHIGVVFVTKPDAIPSAKAVFKFSADNQDLLEVMCGRIEGKVYAGSDVKQLADLPSMDQMRSELIALLVSPMSQVLAVMEAVMAEPLSVIEQKSTQE